MIYIAVGCSKAHRQRWIGLVWFLMRFEFVVLSHWCVTTTHSEDQSADYALHLLSFD